MFVLPPNDATKTVNPLAPLGLGTISMSSAYTQFFQRILELRTRIATIGKEPLDTHRHLKERRNHSRGTVAILHRRRVDINHDRRAFDVNCDMALAAHNLLAFVS